MAEQNTHSDKGNKKKKNETVSKTYKSNSCSENLKWWKFQTSLMINMKESRGGH